MVAGDGPSASAGPPRARRRWLAGARRAAQRRRGAAACAAAPCCSATRTGWPRTGPTGCSSSAGRRCRGRSTRCWPIPRCGGDRHRRAAVGRRRPQQQPRSAALGQAGGGADRRVGGRRWRGPPAGRRRGRRRARRRAGADGGPARARRRRRAAAGALLVLGSSTPVRDVDRLAVPRGATSRCWPTAGVAGIDGTISTAVGAALVHGGPGVRAHGRPDVPARPDRAADRRGGAARPTSPWSCRTTTAAASSPSSSRARTGTPGLPAGVRHAARPRPGRRGPGAGLGRVARSPRPTSCRRRSRLGGPRVVVVRTDQRRRATCTRACAPPRRRPRRLTVGAGRGGAADAAGVSLRHGT